MDPCALLTKEKAASIANIDPELVTVKEPVKMKNPLYLTCTFRWDSDRTTTVKTALGAMEVAQDNQIQIGSFKLLDSEKIKQPFPEYFDGYYKNVTAEDAEKFDKKLQEELAEESETAKKIGTSISKMSLNFNYKSVSGIGDRASWETSTMGTDGHLHVLHGDVIFSVIVNISDDVNDSFDVAKKVANEILALCN
ncbi:hypothetical protein GCM10007940_02290 [Portibacter lacus]|uniref:Uncharacterized protein n=2 Tax=Portibacter lacus TaxID=1099794 RepID=A0AA37WDB9_9BACT|nr:hypothetical protein GCM10007940_02290 [Portibacter lacus]